MKIDIDDLMVNLFNDKYTYDQKLHELAALERNKPEFVRLIRKHHPQLYVPFDNSVATLILLEKLNPKLFGL